MSGRGRMVRAELRAAGGPALALLLLVALAASITIVVPSALLRASSAELTASLGALTENQRNPGGQLRDFSVLDIPEFAIDEAGSMGGDAGGDAVFGSLRDALDAIIAAQPQPLRSALGQPETVVIGEPLELPPSAPRDDDPGFLIRAVLDPDWQQRLLVVDGRLPQPLNLRTATVELALTAEGADTLRWSVGERRLDATSGFAFELVGVVALVEPDSAYAQRLPGVPVPERFDDGNQRPRETAGAFLHPLSLGAPGTVGVLDVQLPIALDAFDAVAVERLLPQVRALTATPLALPSARGAGAPTVVLALESAIPAATDAVLGRTAGVVAVLALAAAAPLGALGVVVLLAAQVIIERRRPVLALRLARGASRSRLRLGMAGSTLALTVPSVLGGAALGALAATLTGMPLGLVIAAATAPAVVGLLVVVALAPALVTAALVPRAADVRERRLDTAAPGRARVLVEVVLLGLAAVAVLALVQRGATVPLEPVAAAPAGAAGLGDPLLIAAPLLIALAASVLVARALPAVMGVVHRATAGRSSAVAAVGVRRASRDRTGRPALVVTLLASSAAIWSLTVLGALDTSLDDAARDSLGASVRLTGPGVSAELVDRVAALPEVAAAGGADVIGPAVLSIAGVRENATVVAVDAVAAALRPDAPADFGVTAAPTDDPVAAILSADLLATVEGTPPGSLPPSGTTISVGGVPVTVVGVGRPAAGYGITGSWVVVGAPDAPRFSRAAAVDTVLVEPVPGVSAAHLVAAIETAAAAGDEIRTAVAAELAAAARAAPLVAALRATLSAGAALALLLSGVALALATLAGRPRRQRIQALLQTLGSRRTGTLLLWELVPAVLLGALGGTAAAALLLPLTSAAVDLRLVTGAAEPLAARLDPSIVGATLVVLAVIAIAVIGTAALLDRRPALLTTLRTESS